MGLITTTINCPTALNFENGLFTLSKTSTAVQHLLLLTVLDRLFLARIASRLITTV